MYKLFIVLSDYYSSASFEQDRLHQFEYKDARGGKHSRLLNRDAKIKKCYIISEKVKNFHHHNGYVRIFSKLHWSTDRCVNYAQSTQGQCFTDFERWIWFEAARSHLHSKNNSTRNAKLFKTSIRHIKKSEFCKAQGQKFTSTLYETADPLRDWSFFFFFDPTRSDTSNRINCAEYW